MNVQSYKDYMLAEMMENGAVRLNDFIRTVSSYPNRAIMILEGKDDEKYYSPRFNSRVGHQQWICVYAGEEDHDKGGKKKVLELLRDLEKNMAYKKSLYFGFIDKDFDDDDINYNVSMSRLYVTSAYSIENFYTLPSVLENFISSEANYTMVSHKGFEDKYSLIFSDYNRLYDDFLNAVYKYNIWIRADRVKSREKCLDKSIKADAYQMGYIYRFDKNKCEIEGVLADKELSDLYPHLPNNYLEDYVVNAEKYFLNRDKRLFFRGKQNYNFFIDFLRFLIEDCNKENCNRYFPTGKTIGFSLTKNSLSELSSYAYTPDCLNEFLSGIQDIKKLLAS